MTLANLSVIKKCPQLLALRKAQEDPQYGDFSDDSKEILKHFGSEAPHLLNEYANHLEDTILQLVGDLKAMREEFSLTYDADHEEQTD